LNRVTQGIYQPGGALETVILAALLSDKRPLDTPVAEAAAPVQVNGLTLTCAASASAAATIGGAYTMACPALFADAVSRDPGPADVQKVISVFGLLQAPTLVGFETLAGPSVLSLTAIQDPAQLRAQGVGQGDLTVTPLQMVLVAATVANHGHAITPYLVDATRRPGATAWQPIPPPANQTAVVTQEVADTIQTAMRDAVTKGAAQAANRSGLAIYGHASIAYTGPEQNADAWFIGFIELPAGRSVAVAAVIEDTTDAATAANIGGIALAEAAR
jgi:peptidoglycan glycosyltransferase